MTGFVRAGRYLMVLLCLGGVQAWGEEAPPPAPEIPAYAGAHYKARVPDTLDLAERARLALNPLTRCVEPEADYAVYFDAIFRNPVTLSRRVPLYGKFLEATARARLMSGSEERLEVDRAWRRALIEYLRTDPVLFGPEGGRQLVALSLYYQRERDPGWKALGDRAVRRLAQAVVDKGDYAYLAAGPNQEMPRGWAATSTGWVPQGLCEYYRATGNPEALTLARKLARFLKDHAGIFDSEGRFLAGHESDRGPTLHTHHNANTLEALAEYALITREPEYVEFVRKGYEWARATGNPRVGFFPEYIRAWPDTRPQETMEACNVATMAVLALRLSQMGAGDYWDDVDRYLRNQLAELQLQSCDWLTAKFTALPQPPVGPEETATDAIARIRGSFVGWATANDGYASWGAGIMQCCTGNSTRALYLVWRNMLEFSQGRLLVHLLLNRASPWADVDSYLPYQGRVVVKMKRPGSLLVRLPEWVDLKRVSTRVNGKARPPRWKGRYLEAGRVAADDKVEIKFPLRETTVKDTIGGRPYTLVIRGSEVVSIDPPGKNYPLYQRAHYRGPVRWRTAPRFVAEGDLLP